MTAVAAFGFYFRIVVKVVLCSWSGRRPDHEHIIGWEILKKRDSLEHRGVYGMIILKRILKLYG
jgi:hypothetical protein